MDGLTPIASLRGNARGGISIIGAFSLTGVAGMGGLAMEMSHGYAVKVENQRVADAAALAAAMVYAADTTITDSAANTKILATAKAIAQANGLAATNVTRAELATSAKRCDAGGDTSGRRNVCVTVNTAVPISLTRVVTRALTYAVSAKGEAAVTPGTSGSTPVTTTPTNTDACFLALGVLPDNTSYGMVTSGGNTAGITGAVGDTGCDVQAVKGILVQGSAFIKGRNINSNTNILVEGSATPAISGTLITAAGTIGWPSWNAGSVQASPASNRKSGQSTVINDPLAAGAVRTALAKVTVASNYPIPPAPAAIAGPTDVPTGTVDWTFSESAKSGTGNPGVWNASTKTWSIAKGTYNLKSISLGGDVFAVQFAAGSVVTISGNLNVAGSSRIIVDGSSACPTSGTNCNDWKVAGTVSVGGGGGASSFGHGTYHFGSTANFQRPTTFGSGNITIVGDTTFGGYAHTIGDGAHSFGRLIVTGTSGYAGMTMGAGNLYLVRGLNLGGDAKLTVGAGTKTIGAHSDGRSVAITGGATVANMGSGAATLTGDIWVGGRATLTFNGNMWIGSRNTSTGALCGSTYDANCRSVSTEGGWDGPTTTLVNFGAGSFVSTGGITNGGWAKVIIGASATHWIRGDIALTGFGEFGAGAYYVWGAFKRDGGNTTTANGVTFYLNGQIELGGSTAHTMTAPTTTSGDALKDILFASLTTTNSTYAGSSASNYSGTIYLPNSAVYLSGAGKITPTGCFVLIAKGISVTGSGAAASKCAGVAAAGTTTTTPTTAATPATVSLVR